MTVGEYDVSSFTEDTLENLLKDHFKDVNKINITLRQARKRNYKDYEFKLGDFQKKYEMKIEGLPLILVYSKEKSRELSKGFPMENYDIIQQVRNRA